MHDKERERLSERFAGVPIWVGGWSREFLAIVYGRMVVARSAEALEVLLSELLAPAPSGVVTQPGGGRILAGDR